MKWFVVASAAIMLGIVWPETTGRDEPAEVPKSGAPRVAPFGNLPHALRPYPVNHGAVTTTPAGMNCPQGIVINSTISAEDQDRLCPR